MRYFQKQWYRRLNKSCLAWGAKYHIWTLYEGGHNIIGFVVERLPSDGVFHMPKTGGQVEEK